MNSGCPVCNGIDRQNCYLCRRRAFVAGLRKGDLVLGRFLGRTYPGGVVVSAKGRIRVRWPDGLTVPYERRHAVRHLGAPA